MSATTPADIASLIELLKASFPNYHPERATAKVFHRLLADLPKELLEAAVIACLSEPGRAFAPSVGEIRGKAGELRARAERLPSAEEAFLEVMDMPADQERHYPRWQDDDGSWVMEVRQRRFSHSLVEKVARALGWPGLFPGDNPAVDRAQFTRAYQAELERAMREAIELPAIREYVAREAALLPSGDESEYEVIRRTRWKTEPDDKTPADQ